MLTMRVVRADVAGTLDDLKDFKKNEVLIHWLPSFNLGASIAQQ